MVKYYKCYRVFLSGTLMKLLMYLIYPVCAFFWCSLAYVISDAGFGNATLGLMMTAGMMIGAELLLDSFVYGGLLAKDSNKLEFLKTSYRGINVLKKSLCVDKLRRLVTLILVFVMICGLWELQISVGRLMSLLFATAMVMELGLLVIRHFSSFNWVLILTMVAYPIGMAVGFVAMKLEAIFAVLFLLMLVAAYLICSKITLKKAEGSFYDTGVEKVL